MLEAIDADRREELELQIDTLAAGGDGVGRDAQGRVVFVPMSAPGDRLRVEISETQTRYARARIVEILSPGAGRSEARCGAFGRCGGCHWQHLDYRVQAEAKQTIVRDALERIARHPLAGGPKLEWFPSPAPYAYRTRARVVRTEEGVGYRAAQSHDLVAVEECPVLVPALEQALQDLSRESTGREPGDVEVQEWELALDAEGRAHTRALGAEPNAREITVGEDRLAASSGVFTQVHASLTDTWSSFVVDAAGSGDCALELFAGVGTLSLPLARHFAKLVAVESEPRAFAHLRENLKASSATVLPIATRINPTQLTHWLRKYQPQVVVLDPPRSGLGASASKCLASPPLRRVVYAACDPATWARDLRVLGEAGLRITQLAAFDFFPQTAHVEVVAVLETP